MPVFDTTLSGLTATTFNGGDAYDEFGHSVSGAGDVNGDGFDDFIVGAPYGSANIGFLFGSARVLSGVDGSVLFTFSGDGVLDRFGWSVSSAGDVNGDGFDDVIVGEFKYGEGRAHVFSGADGSELYIFDGDDNFDLFGISVSGAGDVNGDGFDDVIVGARDDDNNGNKSGSATVFSGADGSVIFAFDGDDGNDLFGISVSDAGDVNGDGFDDFIVGALRDDNTGTNSGSARVFSGYDGSILFTVDGDDANDEFGRSVSGAGDVNGDGFDDVIVGARYDDNNGNQSGSATIFSGVDGSVLHTFDGDDANDQFGFSVSGAGDVNGDGFDDLIVGARYDDNTGNKSGIARVLSGVDGSVLHIFDGDDANDQFGGSVSGAGDVNGDGFDDLIVGARLDDNNGSASGSARVLSGVDGSVLHTFDGDDAGDIFGYSVSGAGDVNGDGFDDVIVGTPYDASNGTQSGSARLFTTTGTGRLDSVRVFDDGDGAVVLDSDVAINDFEFDLLNGGNGDYDGASLNIQRAGGGNGDDLFAFAAMANVTVNGGNLEVGGNAVATFTLISGVLAIAFTNANGETPTRALVNEIIQAVTYENSDTDIGLGEHELLPLEWTFSDGIDSLVDTINISHAGIGGRMETGTSGQDSFKATLADDSFDGLGDSDTLDFSLSTAGLIVNLNQTSAQATGGSGNDTINNIENLIGGSGNDRFIGTPGANGANVLSGGAGNDKLFGLGGDDTLNGGDGKDVIVGGAGADTINGGDGNDVFKGGTGNDILTGGVGRDQSWGDAGADIFVINDVSESGFTGANRDIIRDFSIAEGDRVDLSGIDAITGGGDDAFTLVSSPFSQTAGELRAIITLGGQTIIQGDVDGDGVRDFSIVMQGALALTDSDFIL